MDDALTILEYLPASFKNTNEQNYITFLWEAFESNYQSGKYQFALLAFHMLYMSFVYFSVWKIKLERPDDFAKVIFFQKNDMENKLINASSPFTFSLIQEAGIFNFLRLIDGCEKYHTGGYAKLVGERNEIAHSNGNIFYSDQITADEKIADILRQIASIQSHMKPIIHECFVTFLLENWNREDGYLDERDEVREALVHTKYFSQEDINACLTFDILTLSQEEGFDGMGSLFDTFVSLYHEIGS